MAGENRGRFKAGASGNPKGRPPRVDAPTSALATSAAARAPTVRRDGWSNSASGHGTARDRRTLTRYGVDIVTDLEALQLWRSEPFAAKIIEQNPKKALSRGWALKLEDKEQAERVIAQTEALGLLKKFSLAWQTENAYGGAALFPVLSGALGDLSTELDEGAIASVDALHLFEPQELAPHTFYKEIGRPEFGTPETYRLTPLTSGRSGYLGTQIIHASRLVVFPGIRVSKQTQPGQREGWGDSVLCRPKGVLDDFGLAWGSAATLIHSHGQGVLEMDGFANMMSQTDGLDEFDRHMAAQEMAANALRMMVIDAKSKFSRMTGTLAGVSETLNEFKSLMAAAADRPVSVLFGIGQTGLRTGDSDLDSWYGTVEAERADRLHLFERLVRLFLLATAGPTSGVEPDVWSAEFPSLWSPSEKETAETRKTDMDRAVAAVGAGIASADDVAESFYGGDTYSPDIVIDWERRKAQAKIDEERAEDLSDEDREAMGREEDQDGDPGDPDEDDLDALEDEDREDEAWDVPEDDSDLDSALAAARERLAELEAKAAAR
jgi:phage-related protein (TIGR01555 family)